MSLDSNVPLILNKWMLPDVLHYFMGTQFCTSVTNSIIFMAFENLYLLHSLAFLLCKKVTNFKLNTVKIIPIYA